MNGQLLPSGNKGDQQGLILEGEGSNEGTPTMMKVRGKFSKLYKLRPLNDIFIVDNLKRRRAHFQEIREGWHILLTRFCSILTMKYFLLFWTYSPLCSCSKGFLMGFVHHIKGVGTAGKVKHGQPSARNLKYVEVKSLTPLSHIDLFKMKYDFLISFLLVSYIIAVHLPLLASCQIEHGLQKVWEKKMEVNVGKKFRGRKLSGQHEV